MALKKGVKQNLQFLLIKVLPLRFVLEEFVSI
jgi:hypothetical protein